MSPRKSRPALVRIAPFGVFMLLLALRGALSEGDGLGLDQRWIYLLTVGVVGGLLCWFWCEYGELAMPTIPTVWETALAV
nr:CPBP family intramembrane metalloprotease [Pseudomonadota bacterium]